MKKVLLICTLFFGSLFAWSQTSGGPDAYGYTWKSSAHTSNPPVYSWVDITTKGIEVEGLGDDNVVGPYILPAGYQFYWYPVTQLWIGSNGYITLNGSNMSAAFPPSVPLPGGGNDWIAAHMSDLNFAGTNNPGTCWYYATNDSLVVSYENVPYWVVSPGFSGSNSFQIILSSVDKSITFNYKSMSAGTATVPVDCVTGIENNTGALGLAAAIDVVPANLSTIKFYYPTVVTYAVTDGGVNWNNNEKNGGYFIPTSNNAISLKANVKNFGNQNISSFTVTDTVYSGQNPLSNGIASVANLTPGQDTTFTFSNSFFAQFASVYTFATRTQGITGDLVQVNNRKTQKIISVDVSQQQYWLDYSDGVPDGTGLSWNGGNGGIAVYIQPPVYPVTVNSTRFHIGANNLVTPVGFSAMIYDDSGPNNGPGNLLDSVYVAPSSVSVGLYNTVATNSTVNITSGGVYILWYMGGDGIQLSRDLTKPISARSFEVLGTIWAEYRAKLTEDFLIGMNVTAAPSPVANFSIDKSLAPTISFTDLSTNTPTSWFWDFGDTTVASDTSILQNPSYTYSANGTYSVCLTATNYLGSHTVCKDVTISNIGIEEAFLDFNSFIYPNPASGVAFLDLPESVSPNDIVIRVYNLQGQRVKVPYSANGSRMELDIKELNSGAYFFELLSNSSDENIAQGKFMVE